MRASMLIALVLAGATGGAAVVLSAKEVRVAESTPSQIARIGEMSNDRAAHQTTALDGGRLLITGGCAGSGCREVLSSAEVYDPVSRTFSPHPALSTPRASHAAAALPSGAVLIAGGWNGRAAVAEAELLDPATGRFVPTGRMNEARISPMAAALPDGRVLIVGGELRTGAPLASAEVFDPATATFTSVGAMHTPRGSHVAIGLPDGRVLVTGGHRARGDILRSAEIFDPATLTFQRTGDMHEARHKHAAALLPDGRVLILGGSDARDSRGRLASTEIFDPATGAFSPGPPMNSARYKFRDAVVTLGSGAVLVAGGAERPELWQPASGTFVEIAGSLGGVQEFATASLLPNGDVLILGGYDERIRPAASAWLFRP